MAHTMRWDGIDFEDSGDGWIILSPPEIGSPELRSSPTLLPLNHGGIGPEAEYAGVRQIVLEARRHADAVSNYAALMEVSRSMQPGSVPGELRLQLPGLDARVLFARPAAPRPVVERWAAGQRIIDVRLEWICHDPVLYGAELKTAALEPYVGTAFATYPADASPTNLLFGSYPKLYGSGGSGGGIIVVNAGTWPVWPRFVIVGPSSGSMTVERLENITTGGVMQFTEDGGLTIPAGSTVIVDTHPARRIVRFTSGADRLNTVTDLDGWWQIQPGDNELRFRAGGDTAGAGCTVEHRDGWL